MTTKTKTKTRKKKAATQTKTPRSQWVEEIVDCANCDEVFHCHAPKRVVNVLTELWRNRHPCKKGD